MAHEPSTEPFTAADLYACATREIRQRRRVYPGLVMAQKMKPSEADRQIAMMERIADDYRKLAEAEAAKGDLFGGER